MVNLRVTGIFHSLYRLGFKVLQGEYQNMVTCYILLHIEGHMKEIRMEHRMWKGESICFSHV